MMERVSGQAARRPAATEVLLFHHAQGLTSGVRAFADTLRAAGHTVHTPDLFDGRIFESIEEGLAYIGEIGFDDMRDRGVRAADELPAGIVYAGFSFGVMPAQKLAQTRPGARGRCFSTPACRSAARGPLTLARWRPGPDSRHGQ